MQDVHLNIARKGTGGAVGWDLRPGMPKWEDSEAKCLIFYRKNSSFFGIVQLLLSCRGPIAFSSILAMTGSRDVGRSGSKRCLESQIQKRWTVYEKLQTGDAIFRVTESEPLKIKRAELEFPKSVQWAETGLKKCKNGVAIFGKRKG